MKKFLFIFFLLLIFQNLQAQKNFDELSLQEKIGQTLFVYADTNTADQVKSAIQKGLVGGVLVQWGNYSREETKELINTLQGWAKESPNKIPLLIAVDYEGGTVYSPSTLGLPYLPSNMVIAAANDYENTKAFAFTISQELKALGIHIDFAPVMDVNSNPQNPIIGVRSFGNNKEIVANMGEAIISGLQEGGIIAVAKHFPGHGDASLDTHLSLTVFEGSKEELFDTHIYPFKKAIEAGVKGIMSSHIRYPFFDNKLATYSKIILTDLLRKELNFDGIIFTDSLDMKGALLKDISKAAALAIRAGADVALIAKEPPQKAIDTIQKKVSKERIEEASAKIYNLKKELKLFDENHDNQNNGADKAIEALSKEITRESITLIRDEENLIPYKTEKQNPKL
nr:glycoside hydrolase family 3 protein [Elusimicrobiaceae bacterium]